ncbi:MAG: hypothetical protein PWP23_2560 [Candidatus Sumerlaeota bacterium]|nr:hypothetical protein [Candidatus Sumerlaeota bacterium]
MRAFATRIVLAALLLVAAGTARASVAVPLTVEQMAAVAQDVVHATVEESQVGVYDGKIYTRHRLAIHESLKGANKSGGSMEIVAIGGDLGKLSAVAPGMATLDEGEEVILFMSNPAKRRAQKAASKALPALDPNSPFNQSPQIIGGFQGKFEVVRRSVEKTEGDKTVTEEKAVVFRANPGKRAGADGYPDLDAFKAQVREVVQTTDKAKIDKQAIATVGVVDVVAKSDKATALRFFDPIGGIGAKAKSMPNKNAALAEDKAPATETEEKKD